MRTPQLERLRDHCHRLRLYQIENELTAGLEQAAKKEVSYADFLDELLPPRSERKPTNIICGDHRPRFNGKFGGCSLPRSLVWDGLSFMSWSAMRAWFAGDATFPGRP